VRRSYLLRAVCGVVFVMEFGAKCSVECTVRRKNFLGNTELHYTILIISFHFVFTVNMYI
jgi:hypothetical protein